MKRIFILTFLMLVLLFQVCHAESYFVNIVDISKKVIIDKVASDMVNQNGFMIANINDYQAVFRKDMNDFGDRLLYGSKYNNVPELRLSCSFTDSGRVIRVTMEPRVVTNPGSAYEKYTMIKDSSLLDYLNTLKWYFNGRVDTGIAWNPKKKGDFVEVVRVAKGSNAEKAGVVAGDLIAKVNGIAVNDLSMDKFLAAMSGPEGKQIVLVLKRPAGEVTVTVIHALIPPEYN